MKRDIKKIRISFTEITPAHSAEHSGILEIYEAYQLAKKRFAVYEMQGKQLKNVRDSKWNDYVNAITQEGYLYQYTVSMVSTIIKNNTCRNCSTIGQLLKSDPTKIKDITSNEAIYFLI